MYTLYTTKVNMYNMKLIEEKNWLDVQNTYKLNAYNVNMYWILFLRRDILL